MSRRPLANDNKELDRAGLDPDRHFVRDCIHNMCELLKERGVDRELIADTMLTELFKMLEGNPFRSPGDEGAVRADQSFLWGMKFRIVEMSTQWDKGWVRIRREKGLTASFNKNAPRPKPIPLLVKREPPACDYDALQFSTDCSFLRLRAGHAYTEREVMARYRRLTAKMAKYKTTERTKFMTRLTKSKQRIIGWMERTGQIAKASGAK